MCLWFKGTATCQNGPWLNSYDQHHVVYFQNLKLICLTCQHTPRTRGKAIIRTSRWIHAGTTRKLGQWSCAPKMGTGFTPGWYSMTMHDLYGWKLRFMVILLISIWIASFIWVWFENSAPLNPWSYFSSKKCAKKLPFRCIPHFQTQSLGKSTIEGIYDGNRRGQVLSGFMKYPPHIHEISMKYP
jgi:hypothetical protein